RALAAHQKRAAAALAVPRLLALPRARGLSAADALDHHAGAGAGLAFCAVEPAGAVTGRAGILAGAGRPCRRLVARRLLLCHRRRSLVASVGAARRARLAGIVPLVARAFLDGHSGAVIIEDVAIRRRAGRAVRRVGLLAFCCGHERGSDRRSPENNAHAPAASEKRHRSDAKHGARSTSRAGCGRNDPPHLANYLGVVQLIVTADRFAGIVADVDAVPWVHACAALARSRSPSGPSHGIAPENASRCRAEAFCIPASSFVQLAKDFGMAKRSTREAPAHSHGGAVSPLFGPNWHPLAVERDSTREQSYLRKVRPQSDGQRALMAAIERHSLTLALGPAGTGKTYLAITAAVEALEGGKVGRIVLTRPAIEAGESLGFLPGDLHEKLAPYLRPLYDALNERIGGKRLRQLMTEGAIEIAPVAYMRGRTLNNAFVVIDEAQNCTYGQIKMLLTRLGWHSTMILTGDPDQSDLLDGLSGFADIARRLEVVPEIAVVRLSDRDIVRHPLVASMLTVL